MNEENAMQKIIIIRNILYAKREEVKMKSEGKTALGSQKRGKTKKKTDKRYTKNEDI